MRLLLSVITGIGLLAFHGLPAHSQPAKTASQPPLVLAGGTVVDVRDWGHSARDLADAVVIIREGRIVEVGTRSAVPIPKNAQVIDCTGKFLLPGLVDGYAGINSQGQASAFLAMGVTTVVVSSDATRGPLESKANPAPHLYRMESAGVTDDANLLRALPSWNAKLKQGTRPAELPPAETAQQLAELAKMGVRVVRLGPALTAANTQAIIARAHQLGMATYGEFVATPYKVGIEAGVDALPRMGQYELGVIPDELQRPLVSAPVGPAASTAYDYAERLPTTDLHLRAYARFLAAHRAALMPAFSLFYLRLPGHRNLWLEPAARLLDPDLMDSPSDPETGEALYPLFPWMRHLPKFSWRWMEDNQHKQAEAEAQRLWKINAAFFAAYPHYLAGSGASSMGTMAGISLHTELEMLVRLGLTPREALAAATNNFSLQFGWHELGLIAPGRRADILVVDESPTANVWNTRRIHLLLKEGVLIDRDKLLAQTVR